jgi:hypothetical protein
MKSVSIIALLAIASPAFAQVPADKQSAPVQDKKPFLYDGLMPNDSGPPARDNPGVTLTIGRDCHHATAKHRAASSRVAATFPSVAKNWRRLSGICLKDPKARSATSRRRSGQYRDLVVTRMGPRGKRTTGTQFAGSLTEARRAPCRSN